MKKIPINHFIQNKHNAPVDWGGFGQKSMPKVGPTYIQELYPQGHLGGTVG